MKNYWFHIPTATVGESLVTHPYLLWVLILRPRSDVPSGLALALVTLVVSFTFFCNQTWLGNP